MVEVGLTGGIASGKSTVANFFKELGVYLIDWDVLAQEVVHPYLKAWEGIVKYFGKEVLNEDLTINRQKLGEIVFNDKEKLEKLNQIVHPEVFKEDERRVDKIRRLNSEAVIIKDIPLLIEVGLQRFVDKVVVVYASEEIQIKRLVERGAQLEEAKKRVKAQQPLEEKVKFADFVIYNNGSLEETRKQVERIYGIIKKEARVHHA